MKYRIVECKQNENIWYEIHYRVLWMWFPVQGVFESTAAPPRARMFATKEQAEHYIDMRKPPKVAEHHFVPVERKVIAEHDR